MTAVQGRWSGAGGPLYAALDQVDALSRAFLIRFFESEITAATDDLKQPFFWLLAALAVPGMFIPWIMGFEWQLMALVQGAEAVRIASRAEKAFYLGFSMAASGILTAIVWSSLLPDRRDTLILGTLPLQPRTIVVAKLAALAAYLGLVAVGMHAVGSVFWGMILGDAVSPLFSLRGVFAHFVASSAASVSVFLAVAAAQGLTLAVAGPRLFRRLSTMLQVVIVALAVVCLAVLPRLNSTVVGTLADPDGPNSWLLSLPPVWFLGLYEWLLGTSDPLLLSLAGRALTAVTIVGLATVLSYPLAYRRLMVSVVEEGGQPENSVASALRRVVVRAAGTHPASVAAAEFFTTTLARVDRQRFVLAIATGLAIAWALPVLHGYTPSEQPSASILGLPVAVMMFLTVSLRVAASLPSDVRASWVFEIHDLSRQHARQAVERTMLLLGVLVPVAVSVPVYLYLWGAMIAISHALVIIALGIAVVELLIWHCVAMPCGQRWTPARIDFAPKWPLHFALFLIIVVGVPQLEVMLFQNASATASFVAVLFLIAGVIRYRSATHEIVPAYDDVDPVAGVLRLN